MSSVYEATEALVAAVRAALYARTPDDLIADPGMGTVDAALKTYEDAKAAERKAMQASTDRLNAFLRQQLGGGPSPSYRYFEHKGVRYCWNTKPVSTGDGKWYAWEYRPMSGQKNRLEMKHRVRCATRTKAKEKARAWVRAAEGL